MKGPWTIRIVVGAGLLAVSSCSGLLGIDPDKLSVASPSDAPGNDAGNDASSDGAPGFDAATGTDGAPSPPGRYPAAVMADHPVVYLRLGEGGGTVAKEQMGNANGTYATSGITYGAPGALAGDPDTAVSFTDGTGRITMPPGAEFDGTLPYSVEVWVRPSPSNNAIGLLVDHSRYNPRSGWTLLVNTGGIAFERWANENGAGGLTAKPPKPDAWQYVVAIYDGSDGAVFLDGAEIARGQGRQPIPDIGTTYTIGHGNYDCCDNAAFVGAVDELAIYDKALTKEAIERHYAAAK